MMKMIRSFIFVTFATQTLLTTHTHTHSWWGGLWRSPQQRWHKPFRTYLWPVPQQHTLLLNLLQSLPPSLPPFLLSFHWLLFSSPPLCPAAWDPISPSIFLFCHCLLSSLALPDLHFVLSIFFSFTPSLTLFSSLHRSLVCLLSSSATSYPVFFFHLSFSPSLFCSRFLLNDGQRCRVVV